uniref:Outer capsid protein VP2 n=1 Tax=Changuinola virus TaxID=40052 RepID=A0A3Q8AJG7_9REOV|nr:VP2 [Changuinola virus]
MATELTIAVAQINENLSHDALFNNYDLIIDTSKKALTDSSGRWRMDLENTRKNIFTWGTNQLIDDVIKGKPGTNSYLSLANGIDSVLGEITDESLEDRDKVQIRVSQELNWAMNMQSQEWKVSRKNLPQIECKFGSVYAQDHHFESLVFYRCAVPDDKCSHQYLNEFNENVFSDLHNIMHNTVYIIDYPYKVRCVDDQPYRFPTGIIYPYRRLKKSEYDEILETQIFDESFNTFIYNDNKGDRIFYILNDFESGYRNIEADEVINLEDLNKQLRDIDLRIADYKKILEDKHEHMSDGNIIYKNLNDINEIKDEVVSRIAEFDRNKSQCDQVHVKYAEQNGYEMLDMELVDEEDYNPIESGLELGMDITNIFNDTYKNIIQKQLMDNDTLSGFLGKISMAGCKTSEDIQKKYDSIENQYGRSTGKWLDIMQSTMGYYRHGDEYVIGYGPLKVEGLLTSDMLKEMSGKPEYKDLIELLQCKHETGEKPMNINSEILCKLFEQYSRDHPNRDIIFEEDDEIYRNFKEALHIYFNLGIREGKEWTRLKEIDDKKLTRLPVNYEVIKKVNEKQILAHKKNVVKLGILISQVYGGYVDDTCPIHVLRGGMLYARSLFGDVYDMLKTTFAWDVNDVKLSLGWDFPIKHIRIKPLIRMNVYENKFVRGRVGVCWNIYWNKLSTVHIEFGYPHFVEDSQFIQSQFEEQKTNDYYQKMFNANTWDEVGVELDELLNKDAQFNIKNILTDFYLDDRGFLVSPSYYGRQIYYNVIANCNYKCVATETNKTTDDKNEFKHTSAQRLLVPENWFLPFQKEYDSASICQGQAIATVRQLRGRLERTYIDAIGRNEEFRKFINVSEREIVNNQCPITYPSKFIPWRFFTQLFSLYVNFMPMSVRKQIQKQRIIKVYPDVQIYEIDYDVSNIYTGIYRIFMHGYNAVNIKKDRDIYLFLRHYQRARGEERLHLLKTTIPQLYNIITSKDDRNVDKYFVLNFLFLLTGININSSVQKDTYVPLCYCRSSGILITSIKLSASNKKNFSSCYLPYLSRFFGFKQHREWRYTNEVLINIRDKAVNYYIGEVIVSISKELEICQTKQQNLAMWVGSKCGGVCERVLFFQAITYPKAAYILIVIGDEKMNYEDTLKDIHYNYQTSFQSCKGVVLCKVFKDEILDFKITGTLKVRKMRRDFWGLSHDMLLIKSMGDIFGNAHIVTKLMNI